MKKVFHEKVTCGCDSTTFYIQRIFLENGASYHIYCAKCGAYVASVPVYSIRTENVEDNNDD